jgi:phosphomannomutase
MEENNETSSEVISRKGDTQHNFSEYKRLSRDGERLEQDLDTYGVEELMKRLKFSTGGMRGIMRSGFNGINEVTCNILGTELSSRYDFVVIGCDGRHNSLEYARLFANIFHRNGKRSCVYTKVPTPFLSFLVKELGTEAGVMITASHNPKEYNGIKVYTSDGCQLGEPLDSEIEEGLRENNITEDIEDRGDVELDSSRLLLIDKYCESMFRSWDGGIVSEIRSTKMTVPITFTALCGVSAEFVDRALSHYGLREKVHFVESQCGPDPDFPGLPFPNPEIEETFGRAEELGLSDIVFACDPDGDRFGLAERVGGRWVHYNGDEIAAILSHFFIRRFDPAELAFVNTHLCNGFMTRMARKHGIEHKKTEAGFKNVSRAVRDVVGKHVFAYEDSLGFLFGGGDEKDGIRCAVLMAHLVQRKPPSEMLREMMDTYGVCSSCTVHVRSERPEKQLRRALEGLRDVRTEGKRHIIEREGYRIILRVSGTEPIIKVYGSSESLDKGRLAEHVSAFIEKTISMHD